MPFRIAQIPAAILSLALLLTGSAGADPTPQPANAAPAAKPMPRKKPRPVVVVVETAPAELVTSAGSEALPPEVREHLPAWVRALMQHPEQAADPHAFVWFGKQGEPTLTPDPEDRNDSWPDGTGFEMEFAWPDEEADSDGKGSLRPVGRARWYMIRTPGFEIQTDRLEDVNPELVKLGLPPLSEAEIEGLVALGADEEPLVLETRAPSAKPAGDPPPELSARLADFQRLLDRLIEHLDRIEKKAHAPAAKPADGEAPAPKKKNPDDKNSDRESW